jgi:hypothetical protein
MTSETRKTADVMSTIANHLRELETQLGDLDLDLCSSALGDHVLHASAIISAVAAWVEFGDKTQIDAAVGKLIEEVNDVNAEHFNV